MKSSELLENIATILQLEYLSELRRVNHCDLQEAVSKINKSNYSIAQWRYTLSYILGLQAEIANFEDIDKVLHEMVEQSHL